MEEKAEGCRGCLAGQSDTGFQSGPLGPIFVWVGVRFGSEADIQRPTRLRPLLGVKRTSNVRYLSPDRFRADDVRLWG